ncbi:hypothetical protein JW948_10555 [bacterium]|nr:hypothetical protein [bacterium]
MEQLHVVFYERDVVSVADALVKQGSLQLIDSAEMETWAENLKPAGTGETSVQLREKQELLESMFHQLGVKPDLGRARLPEEPWSEIDARINKLRSELNGLLSMQEETGRELNRLRELHDRLQAAPRTSLPVGSGESTTYLAVETGRVANENLGILENSLQSVLHVFSRIGEFGGMTTVVLVSLRRDQEKLKKALREAGAQPVENQKESDILTPEAIRHMESQISDIQKKFDQHTEKIREFTDKQVRFLSDAYYHIKREALKQRILKYFRKTEHTYLISGWIPAKERESLIAEIRHATRNRCIVESLTADEVQAVRDGRISVPVKMNNPRLIKPFELITGAYGLPAYRTVDPTPVLGLSFLVMFGMMFGDVGHGLVLALAGLFFLLKGGSEIRKHIGLLLCYVGSSSMIFGFLFGSLFGFEDLSWLPPLWFRPMESMNTLIKVCLYFGIGMIMASMLLNMVNAIRLKKFWHVIFNKAGLVAVWFYWSGIVLVSRVISKSGAGHNEDLAGIATVVLVSSLVLLFFNEPIVHLLEGKKRAFPEGVVSGLISGLIEVFEIVLGFLANTVSFVRIAAFGLVHAGLAMAVFALSDAVGGGVGSVFVIIFGNIFIILLETLVVSIQTLRLEFYEFFGRFFQEGKLGYRPVNTELK